MDNKTQSEEKVMMTLNQARIIREQMQDTINILQGLQGSREISLSITKLQESKMWLGMQMGNMDGEDLNAKRDKELLKD